MAQQVLGPPRPREIKAFEALLIFSLVLVPAEPILEPNLFNGQSTAFFTMFLGFWAAVLFIPVFLVSRRRSIRCKWILTVWLGFGIPLSASNLFLSQYRGDRVFLVVKLALSALALYALFTPAARAWLNQARTR
jgi:hypothetical protein